ncbi:hypothetical protein IAI10_10230 [Clostridium sp. 19966]|uniref:hypothetical protein n=1 Tax=Clostridium sp. 19966 TaxID=2768166 RepID=UPI0028DFF442|nr:hypothetical protein [Clostridium sp. 19966]MDT8717035.1 hypothetical protein [Clostridium sp. 19966]
MLLYISSNQNIGIFDFLTKEKGIIIKKLSGEFFLNKFVIHDMRNLSHYRYVAIDVKAIKDTEQEIIEALKAFKVMYDSRIIIFDEGKNKEEDLIKSLVNEKIYNIITANTVAEIKEEILKCVSEEGMAYEDYFTRDNNKLSGNVSQYIFKQKDIKIAVAGVSRRCGTTTTAFNLTNCLYGLGAKVSYTEANDNNHLKDITDFYEFIKDGGESFKYRGVEYYPVKQFPNEYNFNVFDIGVLNGNALPIYKACNVRILCGGSKPYEIVEYKKALEPISKINISTILNFCPEIGRTNLKKLIENENIKAYFTDYSPNLFDGKVNEKIFKDILKDYIIEI